MVKDREIWKTYHKDVPTRIVKKFPHPDAFKHRN